MLVRNGQIYNYICGALRYGPCPMGHHLQEATAPGCEAARLLVGDMDRSSGAVTENERRRERYREPRGWI
jgi:hypothetical protein